MRGAPGRGSSSNLSRHPLRKRARHLPTSASSVGAPAPRERYSSRRRGPDSGAPAAPAPARCWHDAAIAPRFRVRRSELQGRSGVSDAHARSPFTTGHTRPAQLVSIIAGQDTSLAALLPLPMMSDTAGRIGDRIIARHPTGWSISNSAAWCSRPERGALPRTWARSSRLARNRHRGCRRPERPPPPGR